MIVLTLNGGSSSLKFGLYRVDGAVPEALMTGAATADGLEARDSAGVTLAAIADIHDDDPARIMPAIVDMLQAARLPAPDLIAHRIVHGGPHLRSHCLIDDAVLRELESVRALSPLHAPAALAIIAQAQAIWPDACHMACLDTAFHATMPDITRTLPLPIALRDEGIQRYGFHGLSCESIVEQLMPDLPRRLIIAHLGNGASVTAVLDGRSIDTSMGLTPTGGVVMATRSGDIDPGVLLYLLREKGYDAAAIEQLVDHGSGLIGISGLSSDVRVLHAAAHAERAQLAIAMFALSVAKQIAAMMTSLRGGDAIVFTGGIGEHDAIMRAAISAQLEWTGIIQHPDLNGRAERPIAGPATPAVRVLPSREDEQMARHARRLWLGS